MAEVRVRVRARDRLVLETSRPGDEFTVNRLEDNWIVFIMTKLYNIVWAYNAHIAQLGNVPAYNFES